MIGARQAGWTTRRKGGMAETGPGGSNWVTNRKKRRIPCQLWVGEREHFFAAHERELRPPGRGALVLRAAGQDV